MSGSANPRWRVKRMRNPQVYVSGKRPIWEAERTHTGFVPTTDMTIWGSMVQVPNNSWIKEGTSGRTWPRLLQNLCRPKWLSVYVRNNPSTKGPINGCIVYLSYHKMTIRPHDKVILLNRQYLKPSYKAPWHFQWYCCQMIYAVAVIINGAAWGNIYQLFVKPCLIPVIYLTY